MKDWGLLALRVGAGGLMLPHGFRKLIRLFEQGADGFPDPLGIGSWPTLILAILIEFFGAVLLILGISTRIVAVLLALTMLVAVFIVHAGAPFADRELAALFFVAFLSLALIGGGRYATFQMRR